MILVEVEVEVAEVSLVEDLFQDDVIGDVVER